MESLFRFHAPAGPCGYLPDQTWRLEYEHFAQVTAAEYLERMRAGWRRFGYSFFHNDCPSCTRCRSVRVLVDRFQPNRSQRRCWKLNSDTIQVRIGIPTPTRAKLRLYDRFHAFQTEHKGWPFHPAKDVASFAESFTINPFPTMEWCYYLENRLVGVGYVDDLPGGLSAIYFFHDPRERTLTLGTFNVLKIIEHAQERGIPHVYLGYFVEGCPSMQYKVNFIPNELRWPDGEWREFRT